MTTTSSRPTSSKSATVASVNSHVPASTRSTPDNYLGTRARDLSGVLSSAGPAADHPDYDLQEMTVQTAVENRTTVASDGLSSMLFDLEITDVTGFSWGYRGPNQLGHHGQSENYFVLAEGAGVAYDHKCNTA